MRGSADSDILPADDQRLNPLPIRRLVDLQRRVFGHFVNADAPAEPAAVLLQDGAAGDVEGAVFHQSAGEVLAAWALERVIIDRGGVIVPEEAFATHGAKQGVQPLALDALQRRVEILGAQQRRGSLDGHQPLKRALGQEVEHDGFGRGLIGGKRGRALDDLHAKVQPLDDTGDLRAVRGDKDRVYVGGGGGGFQHPGAQGFAGQGLDVFLGMLLEPPRRGIRATVAADGEAG